MALVLHDATLTVMRTLTIAGVACCLTAAGCAESNLPEGGWNQLGVMLDQAQSKRDLIPVVELGATVYAKIVVGGVSVRSSDDFGRRGTVAGRAQRWDILRRQRQLWR